MSIFKRKPKPQPAAVSDAPVPVPVHIAIIMDGNGRWAKRRGMPRYAGHAYGAETFRRIANHCRDIGVRYLTVYAFSTENWKRSEEEISAIMRLLGDYLKEALADMDKNRVRFVFFGDLTRLSPELQTLCQQAADRSRQYDGVQVNFCLNYGGRDEILRAARRFAQACLDGQGKAGEPDGGAVFESPLFRRCAGPGAGHPPQWGAAHVQLPAVADGVFRIRISR